MIRKRRVAGNFTTLTVGAWCVAVLLCAGCVSLPKSGPVKAGGTGDVPDYSVGNQRPGPNHDASPAHIVEGFLAASASPAKDFAVSRQFLTEAASMKWVPTSSVTVISDPQLAEGISTKAVQLPDMAQEVMWQVASVTVAVEGTLSEHGVFEAAPVGESRVLVFELTEVLGQWRISDVPQGLIVDRPSLRTAFRSVTLAYPTADASGLVPDVRWFPNHDGLPTVMVRELLTGPAPHLAGAVRSAFPKSITLKEPTGVEKKENKLRIDLEIGNYHMEDDVLALMRAQLVATFSLMESSENILFYVDGRLVEKPKRGETTFVQPVAGPILAVRGQEVVELGETGVPEIVVPADHVPGATIVSVTPPVSRNENGSVVMLVEPGRDVWSVWPAHGEARTLLTGEHLAPPSTDRHRWVWSVDQKPGGLAKAAHTSGRQLDVGAVWGQDDTPWLLRVAPDGARAAVVTRSATGMWQIGIAGIVRLNSAGNDQPQGFVHRTAEEAADGKPQFVQVFSSDKPISDVVWQTATDLVAMTVSGTDSAAVPLGAPTAGEETFGQLWGVALNGTATAQANPVPGGRHVVPKARGPWEWVDTSSGPGGSPGEGSQAGADSAPDNEPVKDLVAGEATQHVRILQRVSSRWHPVAGTEGVWGPRSPG